MKQSIRSIWLVLLVASLTPAKVMILGAGQEKEPPLTIERLRERVRLSLKKLVACLRGEETCSKEDIIKTRQYAATTMAVVLFFGAPPLYQALTRQRTTPYPPKLKPEETISTKRPVEGKEEETFQETLASAINEGVRFMRIFQARKKTDTIDWQSESGKAINDFLTKNWNKRFMQPLQQAFMNLGFTYLPISPIPQEVPEIGPRFAPSGTLIKGSMEEEEGEPKKRIESPLWLDI